jgi:hypothetical protein
MNFPRKYVDVRRYYVQKYGERVGHLKFQVYLLKRKNQPPHTKTLRKRTSRFRINILKF